MQNNSGVKNGPTKTFEQGLAEILAELAIQTPLFQGYNPVYLRPFVDQAAAQPVIQAISQYAKAFFLPRGVKPTLAPTQAQDPVLAEGAGISTAPRQTNPDAAPV